MRNIDCETAQEWIVSKLDNSLDEEQCRSLQDHLAACEACREAESVLQDLWSALAEDRLKDPGEAYWRDYRRSLAEKLDKAFAGWRHSWGFWRMGWKLPAVLAPAMLVLALIFAGSNGQAPVQQQPVDSNTCRKLLVDLNEVYGPTSEETMPSTYTSSVKSELVTMNKAAMAGAMLTWFEVEDDPTTPYL